MRTRRLPYRDRRTVGHGKCPYGPDFLRILTLSGPGGKRVAPSIESLLSEGGDIAAAGPHDPDAMFRGSMALGRRAVRVVHLIPCTVFVNAPHSFATPQLYDPMQSGESLEVLTPLVAALLRGEGPASVQGMDAASAAALADACVVHGVHGVLFHQLSPSARWLALPDAVRERLDDQARADMAWELAHKAGLAANLEALADAGVEVLLLKGTALAYSLYPVPSIRSRGDTDLFIRSDDLPVLCDVLERLGFAKDVVSQGIGYQINLRKTDRFGLAHTLDVHWRISNSEVFSEVLGWEEARRSSVALPALGAHAYGLHRVHALIHACIHRASHFHSPYYVDDVAYLERNRLIWLYDIHLLVGALQVADWTLFTNLAIERAVSAVCRDTLQAAEEAFGTNVPSEVSNALSRPWRTELSAQLLIASPWRAAWVDLRAQRGLTARLHFLRDLVLPSRAYMLRKYNERRGWLLPYLYVRRVLEGIPRRMRRFR